MTHRLLGKTLDLHAFMELPVTHLLRRVPRMKATLRSARRLALRRRA